MSRSVVRRRSPAFIISGIALVLSFVLVTGVTAALTVPAVSITAQGQLQSVLPSNTVLYVTADLNPSSSSRGQMIGFASAITRRSDWAALLKPLVSDSGSPSKSACLSATGTKAGGNLSDLGHDTAFVLLPAPAHETSSRSTSKSSLISDLAQNLLIVAPLDVHMTLLQALGGVSFTLPKQPLKYRGTSIYREIIPACDRSSNDIPAVYYAAVFHGYILLGLQTRTVEEIIDTGLGDRKPLTDNIPAMTALQSLPGGVTGSFYMNGSILGRSSALVRRLEAWNLASPNFFRQVSQIGLVAGTAAVQSNGIHATIAMPTSEPTPAWPNDTPLSELLSSGSIHTSDVAMHAPEIVPDWLNVAGLNTLHTTAVAAWIRSRHLNVATIEPPYSESESDFYVPPSPIVFVGGAWSGKRVSDALRSLFVNEDNASTNLSQLWPQAGLLSSEPYAAEWLVADQSLGQPEAFQGYQALWDIDSSDRPGLVRKALQALPFPLTGRLAQTFALSQKSFTAVAGSLYVRPDGVRTLTVNLAMQRGPTVLTTTGTSSGSSSDTDTP